MSELLIRKILILLLTSVFQSAKEFDVGSGRKAIAIIVPQPQIKAWQKIQQKVVRELEKKFSGKHVVILAQVKLLDFLEFNQKIIKILATNPS